MSDESLVSRGRYWYRRLQMAFGRRAGRLLSGGDRLCVCCGRKSWGFLPYWGGTRATPPLGRELRVVGSDLDHYECVRCGANDRERHLQLYCMQLDLRASMAGARILHFAPERQFSRYVADAGPAHYVRADLYPASADVVRVDMLDMQFADGAFDIVIANHVLEHVADDRAALREIRRVLRPGGLAILQTPYSTVLQHTFEDRGIVAPRAREYAYGQDDHVRLYGRDIFEVIAAAGFAARVARHEEALSAFDALVYGVNAQEPFFLFERI